MLRWAYIFLVVAFLAVVFGLSGMTHDSWHLSIYLAIVSLILAIGSYLLHRRSTVSKGP